MNINKIIRIFVCSTALLYSNNSNSDQQFNTYITSLGVQQTNAYLTTNQNSTCLYGVLYIVDLTVGKFLYSQAIAAYTSNKPISRLDYTQDPNTKFCNVTLINF